MSITEKNIYLVGVAGIGMSALARYFHQIGKNVAGYDRAISDLSKRLQAEGIAVNHILEEDAIPFPFRNAQETLVIYTPAIASDNAILEYFQSGGFHCVKRAEVLGMISKELKTIAVAGTHGKTTVSSMIAFLLREAGLKLNAFLGGISHDFSTNLVLSEDAEIMVTEADEFDRSFLHLQPNIAVVTSMDADHLDIYDEEGEMIKAYQDFTNQINDGGTLYTKKSCEQKLEIPNGINLKLYGNSEEDILVSDLEVVNGNYQFSLKLFDKELHQVKCGLAGLHNVENASVAMAVAVQLGVEPELAKEAISRFRGVKRRFDVHIKSDDFVYIDDYAHHPEEIKALLNSVRELYPGRKITSVFQPHLYSRTRDFGEQFADALELSDEVILLELYPAREKPIEEIDSKWLARKIEKQNVHVLQKVQLMNHLKDKELDVLLTIGAGDIDTLVQPIINQFEV